jgi:hypothetical protein
MAPVLSVALDTPSSKYDVPEATTMPVVGIAKRALLIGTAVVAGLTYVWIAGVRAVPKVERRQAERRAARRTR